MKSAPAFRLTGSSCSLFCMSVPYYTACNFSDNMSRYKRIRIDTDNYIFKLTQFKPCDNRKNNVTFGEYFKLTWQKSSFSFEHCNANFHLFHKLVFDLITLT